jgi:CRISPR/Cas system CSM-associated protein Csm3 (group 7 of RAMP superfamily)
MKPMWHGDHSRRIVSRILVEGDLVLQTPAHFGNGDSDDATDMPLLLDPLDESEGRITPLLTGATLAGALRSYLREVESGYGNESGKQSLCVQLFGGLQSNDDGEQSPLIVEDARGLNGAIEFRDGVAINAKSRTADEGKKYDLQLWAAGTRFPLRFELVVREYDDEAALRQALVTALDGLSNGGITLGMRKQRGYGAVTVENWRARQWNLKKPAELLDWLENGAAPITAQTSLETALGTALTGDKDKRDYFTLEATFALDGSMLIRSEGRSADKGPDAVHLKARQSDGNSVASVLSGTSLAGVLRARAFKILATLGDKQKAKTQVDDLFGTDMEELRKRRKQGDKNAQPRASRLKVTEQAIKYVQENMQEELVQNRVSIDRFTGGALETALFNEQPVFGSGDSRLTLTLYLREPKEAEIGLLLQLLKDLWTGDLPVGGESSVGRGRLQGLSATLSRPGKPPGTITAVGERLQNLQWSDGLKEKAEGYAKKLKEEFSQPKQEVAA